MTERDLERLVAAGYSSRDARTRAALLDRAEAAYARWRGTAPRWRWLVPGRVEIFGKHTDYGGGRSLVCAASRAMAVVAGPREDDEVHVCDAVDGRACAVGAHAPLPEDGWSRYVAVVAHRLWRNFPHRPLGASVVIASDIPRAAGMSSSSALVVAVAGALVTRGGLRETDAWRHHIGGEAQFATYLGCIENGSDFPGLPGTTGVGTFGGSEDHVAMITSRPGHLTLNQYVPVVRLGDAALPSDWRLLIATSGVRADKAGAARERYNRLSCALHEVLTIWNTVAETRYASLAAAIQGAGGPGVIRDAVSRVAPASAARSLTRRLMHFVREDARAASALVATAAADCEAVAALARESQREASELLENQVPETEVLAAEALGAGAWAASSFGAGFGGSVWALAPRGEAARIGARWIDRYRARLPHATEAEWFVCHPAPPWLDLSRDV